MVFAFFRGFVRFCGFFRGFFSFFDFFGFIFLGLSAFTYYISVLTVTSAGFLLFLAEYRLQTFSFIFIVFYIFYKFQNEFIERYNERDPTTTKQKQDSFMFGECFYLCSLRLVYRWYKKMYRRTTTKALHRTNGGQISRERKSTNFKATDC